MNASDSFEPAGTMRRAPRRCQILGRFKKGLDELDAIGEIPAKPLPEYDTMFMGMKIKRGLMADNDDEATIECN